MATDRDQRSGARLSLPFQAEPDLILPRAVAALDAGARAASLFSILMGVMVLIGWAADIEILKRIVPGLTAMNPATAVGFLCLGWSLAVLSQPASPIVRRLARVVAAVPVVIGVSRVAALGGLGDLQLDRLLFTAKLIAADFGRANQIAPNTAVNLVLLGAALLLLDRPVARVRCPSQLLSAVAAMGALLALMGYAYGLPRFYGIGTNVAMALPTAVTILVLAAGVLCARPTRGIMTVVASDTSGGAMIRRMLPAVLVVPLALGALRAFGGTVTLGTPFGLWLLAVLIMTVFIVLVGWIAQLLFRSDAMHIAAERTLAYHATHDALTELPNRRLFLDELTLELARARGITAVLFVDLDLFKVVNDSLGHVIGDGLLKAAGVRIREVIGEAGLVGRIGGDEFTVLLRGIPDRQAALDAADRIKRSFEAPFTIDLHEVFTTVSIGIAFSEGSDSARDLLRHADLAMYRAKARGKARYEIFEPEMDTAAKERQQMEAGLRRAIARGELRLFYQPEVEIETGRLVGMEALVRWHHPERGLIAPGDFIGIAEETGLILPIGRWVLLEACRQARAWQEQYEREQPLLVSVNLSGKHLQQARLVDEVGEALDSTGLHPGHLILEITETVAMAGAETTIEILGRLKALGVLIAIDDFGTGFSSLSYLKRFPVDLLKIDKSFVDGVALRGHDAAIVQSIIALGHALGLRVIAEGVETSEQLLKLRALGSELGQGYFFGRPLSDDRQHGMPSLLDAHRRWILDGAILRPSDRSSGEP